MKWSSLAQLILTILFYSQHFAESKYYSATLRRHHGSSDEWGVQAGHVGTSVATAEFSNEIKESGWAFLRVVTNEDYSDGEQAYGAGLLEGNLTCKLMKDKWFNVINDMCNDKDGDLFCRKLWHYLDTNKRWLKKQVERHARTDPYWHQVGLMLKQLQGLQDGCQRALVNDESHQVLQDFTFLMFSLQPETYDLRNALVPEQKVTEPGSCSAMIKWVPDNGDGGDLLVGHVTWNLFTDMVRILKNYEFYFHRTDSPGSPLILGYNMTFSSYPGALHSMDDYYLISSGLATLETTLQNDNKYLWRFVSPNNTVPEFIRSMIANRLARNGWTWTEVFSRHNSGTYNNQWMIVDYKKFERHNSDLNAGLLWIIEQMPGNTKASDVTNILQRQTYWPSYNIPYFPSIFSMSGQTQKVQKKGSFYSYEDNPRAQIFRRDQSKVVNLDTMYNLLRSNDYLNDPLSVCNCTPTHNAVLALSARADLNPFEGIYSDEGLQHMPFGATDLKVTDYELFQNLQFVAVAGPPYESESLTPFQWSTYKYEMLFSHVGQPNLWQFEPVLASWQ